MDIKKIKIKSTGQIIEPIGSLYFNDEHIEYHIPLTNLEFVEDENYIHIDEVTKWIDENFDLQKYSSSTFLFCGVDNITFNVERFIEDLKNGLKNGSERK